jgi:serine/threonine protein kinase
MGTHGYMAPEMVKMLGQSRSQRSGYTAAVDYWSLGVTVFKLLTGYRPFDSMYQEEETTTMGGPGQVQGNSEFRALHKPVEYPTFISDTARSFIQGLLDTNEKTRIGCDDSGIDGLKTHMFFNGLDWITMQQCHLEAPYIPNVPPPREKPAYKSYDDMMKQIDKDEKEELGIEEIDWSELPTVDDQKFFESWDFVSPRTLKIEMGIANAIAGYNENFKIRQILGDNMAGDTIKEGMALSESIGKKKATFKNVFKIAEE